jgi:HK97 family phage prohead protease
MTDDRGIQTLHEGATARLHEYWVHGEGAAKIGWGTPGDFSRCVAHLSKYIGDAEGYCNLAHHAALGYYPATHAKMMGKKRATDLIHLTANDMEDGGMNPRPHLGTCTRAFDFEVRSTGGDGRTLEGYAAVFDTPTRIASTGGDFDETILPGAFSRSLKARTPVLQFEHGRDPRVGAVPIGAIDALTEDSRGLHVRARLYDNPVVEPVRQAIAGQSIKGMSFRFGVPEGGDTWTRRSGGLELREIRDADVHELGPVVFPAYDTTTVSVRSLLSGMDAEERAALVRELAAEVRLAVDLQDFTGRSGARSSDGGEPDDTPDGAESTSPAVRFAADGESLRLLRKP